MASGYAIPLINGTPRQQAVAALLGDFMERYRGCARPNTEYAVETVALRFALWLVDHPQELEATTKEMEQAQSART
jgi:hypothetical protein